jgi:hypothetical protein
MWPNFVVAIDFAFSETRALRISGLAIPRRGNRSPMHRPTAGALRDEFEKVASWWFRDTKVLNFELARLLH